MQHDLLYLLLVHRATLQTVQTIQYIMIEESWNNDLEAELVSMHHLVPGRARSDYGPVQLHHLSCCRVSYDYPSVHLHHLPASTTSPDYVPVHLHHLPASTTSSNCPPVHLHHLPASTTSPDYVPVQLHCTAACRPSPEHTIPLYHSVDITVLQAVHATSLSSGPRRLSDHSAMCYTDSVSPLPSSLLML
jgi:hypothetical protein